MTSLLMRNSNIVGYLMSSEQEEKLAPSPSPVGVDNVEISPAGPATAQFPVQLQRMLNSVEEQGLQSIVGWMSNGAGFIVHDKKKFEAQVMPM